MAFACLMPACFFAQTDTCACDGICYTDRQDANCLECLVNAPKKNAQIQELKEKSTEQSEYINNLKAERDKLRVTNQALRDDVERQKKRKRLWQTITAATCGVIIIETLILLFK